MRRGSTSTCQPGWQAETLNFAGVRDETRRDAQRDMVMFSPACVGQMAML